MQGSKFEKNYSIMFQGHVTVEKNIGVLRGVPHFYDSANTDTVMQARNTRVCMTRY